MCAQITANINNNQTQPKITSVSRNITLSNINQVPQFQKFSFPDDASGKLKTGVVFSTLAGVVISLGVIMAGKGYSLNPAKIFKSAPKDWGLFKVQYKEPEICKMAAGSIIGGLMGGLFLDKKDHSRAKARESIIQAAGNILIPIGCVSAGSRLYDKFKDKIEKFIPQLKSEAKVATLTNRVIKAVPPTLATLIPLTIGILVGNKVGNLINQKSFHVDEERKIKFADFSAHLDDLCLGISLIAVGKKVKGVCQKENKFGKAISRFIPAALMVAGISTGMARELHPKVADCSKK